jgi:hypothetical protein
MIEFATVTAAIATLATSLGGLQARVLERLSGSDALAVQQAVLEARAEGVPRAGARAAVSRAPYRRPSLRYVYASGWMAGTKDVKACILAKIDTDGTTALATKALRGNRSTLSRLRRLRLTAVQAATAFAQGFVSAC